MRPARRPLFVPRVGLGLPNRSTTLVVKPGHEFRVAHPSPGVATSSTRWPSQRPPRSTKGRNAAFCAHTGSSQHHQMFRDVHRSKLRKRPQVFGLSLTSMSQRHFIIYDLEATCWRSRAPKRVEVIEIGAVKVNESLDIVDEFAFCQTHLAPADFKILHATDQHHPIRRRPRPVF